MGNSQSRRQQQVGQQGAPSTQPPPGYPSSAGQSAPRPPAYRAPNPPYPASGPAQNAYYPGYRPPFVPQCPPQQQQQQQGLAVPQQPSQELRKTATIRNAVNLKKPTLQLKALPDDPKKLLITFAFDASAPCMVSTFVGATEEPIKSCRIVNSSQAPAPSISYDKGLGLKFPKAEAAGANQHVVDLGRNSEAVLMTAKGNTYPLIIRLETVTERGIKDGHTLQELEPGASQQQWVQSQTTFASLGKGEDGEYEVRILKQKIWVDGISYELQEIYGMDQAGSGGSKKELTEAEAEDRLCVICLVNERDTTVLPCRHMCMCHECAQELRKQTQRCPICRNPVESLLHIRLNNKSGTAAGADTGGGSGRGERPAAGNTLVSVKA